MPTTDVKTRDASRDFIKKAMNAPLLDVDREQHLARRWKDHRDEDALHQLTIAYMRLVVSIASRFRNYGLAMPDLVQEGNVGLMQAAARFEPDRGVRFSTYASWWIRSAIQDFVLRNWSIVRTGTTAAQKSLFFNLRRLRALISDVGDGRITPANRRYVADQLRVPETEVESMASRLAAADRSLNAAISEDGEGAQWQDLLADERPLPEDCVMEGRDEVTRKGWLNEALGELNEREYVIVSERRLCDQAVTLEALGKRLGISKERVRQIEHQALKKMRATLTACVGDPRDAGLIA